MTNNLPSSKLIIRPASFADIPYIQQIAYDTWPVAYGSILSSGQLDYMLDKLYSQTSLETQMKEHHYFFIALMEYKPVGFASFSKINEQHTYKLQKLYVLPTIQKGGVGQALLTTVETVAKSMGCILLQLNVNRSNNAQSFYLKNGFKINREEDIDIGNSYFMNDYIMEKSI